MKWTTANVKNPNYTANHEIYVGTHTGSFKKLVPVYEDKPFAQRNLQDLSKLDKDSRITALAFGNIENSEILIGHAHNTVQLHSLRSEQVERDVELAAAHVVGLARYDDQLVAGFANGQVQQIVLGAEAGEEAPEKTLLFTTGDDMAHLRQCPSERHMVATGGKGRQNNLKVFDMAAGGKEVFKSKNLPNDFLQLEVPVWDSDVGFIDGAHTLATCSRHGYVRFYDTRKQRRPVQCFATENQMSFTSLVARGNYIYTGSTMGALKAFDIRRMNTFVHTYKGFTGSIADLHLDDTGKYLASASLDRYVRVHHADSCVLLYQCYVKSKAMRVLMRESMEQPNSNGNAQVVDEEQDDDDDQTKKSKNKAAMHKDEEYDAIFDNMQTVVDEDEEQVEQDEEQVDQEEDQVVQEEAEQETAQNTLTGSKRKSKAKAVKNKKKKH